MGRASAHCASKARGSEAPGSDPWLPASRQGVLLGVSCPGLGAICLQRRRSWPETWGLTLEPYLPGATIKQTCLHLFMKRQWYVLGENSFLQGSGRPSLGCLWGWALHFIMCCQPGCFPYNLQCFPCLSPHSLLQYSVKEIKGSKTSGLVPFIILVTLLSLNLQLLCTRVQCPLTMIELRTYLLR